jgi:Homing endonuclease associated repeat/HNH endonuclease
MSMQFELKKKGAQLLDSELLDDLRAVAKLTNRRYVARSDYERHGQFSRGTIAKHFGSWKHALIAAGLEHQDRPTASKELLINDLQRVAKIVGRDVLTLPEYTKHGRWSANPITRIFGGWIPALKAAGLIPGTDRFSDEQLFENMQEVWTKLGRQPRYTEFFSPLSKYSRGTYCGRFGGWRLALEAFIEWVSTANEFINESESLVAPIATINEPSAAISLPIRKVKRSAREINLRLRFRILNNNRFTCVACGRSPATHAGLVLHVDHIVPWSRGGETEAANLQTLCEPCNLGKSNVSFDAI